MMIFHSQREKWEMIVLITLQDHTAGNPFQQLQFCLLSIFFCCCCFGLVWFVIQHTLFSYEEVYLNAGEFKVSV